MTRKFIVWSPERVLALAAIAIWACIGLGPDVARADETEPTLDELFAELADAEDPFRIDELQVEIQRIWLDPGSASIELLMDRARQAMDEEDYDTALIHLDDVVELAPSYAEGWNRRATLLGAGATAVLSLERTVALEPRHYGAWSGLGRIFMDIGNEKSAVDAFERALAVNPHLEEIQSIVERLKPSVGGREI